MNPLFEPSDSSTGDRRNQTDGTTSTEDPESPIEPAATSPQQTPSLAFEMLVNFTDSTTGEFMVTRQEDGTFAGKGHCKGAGKGKGQP